MNDATWDLMYREARERFDAYAGMDAPDLPADTMSALQVRLARWQNTNFGAQPAHRFLLGVVEEVGEFFEATERPDQVDAAGDTCVFATQLATVYRLDFGRILAASCWPIIGPLGLPIAVGRLCHVLLKESQGIRGYDDPDRVRRGIAKHLAELLHHMRSSCQPTIDLNDAYVTTAEKVMKRNWVADPMSAREMRHG